MGYRLATLITRTDQDFFVDCAKFYLLAKCRRITFFFTRRVVRFFSPILVKSDYGYHCRTLNLIRRRFIQLRLISFPFFPSPQRIHSRLSSMSELTACWCKLKALRRVRTMIYANATLFIDSYFRSIRGCCDAEQRSYFFL